jgi:hypothetical protein
MSSHVGAEFKETLVHIAETYHLCQSPPLNAMTLRAFLPSLPDQTNPLYQESGDYYYVKVGTVHADVLAAFFQSLYDFLHSYSEMCDQRLAITGISRLTSAIRS